LFFVIIMLQCLHLLQLSMPDDSLDVVRTLPQQGGLSYCQSQTRQNW